MFIVWHEIEQVSKVVHWGNFQSIVSLCAKILNDSIGDEAVLSIQGEAVPEFFSELFVTVVVELFEHIGKTFNEDCLKGWLPEPWFSTSVPLEEVADAGKNVLLIYEEH